MILMLSLLQPALAGKIRTPDSVEDALAYVAVDRAKAITLLEQAAADGKKKELGVISLHAAEQHRIAGNVDIARGWYDKAQSADDGLTPATELGQLLLDADKGLTAEAIGVLATASDKAILQTQNADRYLLLALMAAKNDDASRVKQYSKKALEAAKVDPAVLDRITARLQRLADSPEDTSVEAEEGDPLERAREALAKGDKDKAAKLASKALEAAEEGSPEARAAAFVLKGAESSIAIQPGKIGVLLPQTGKYEVVGRQIEQALRFGYSREGGKAELVFIDTMGTPEGAVAALERAVFEQGVIAVAGPLLSTNVADVVTAASSIQVPLLSLSQSNEVDDDSWIFQGVPSVGDQAGALAEHLIKVQERTKFGIMAPDTPAGHRASDAFKKEVAERGGEVTGEVFYDSDANALMPFAAKLGGKEGREGELRRLRDEAKENGHDPSTVVLPPKTDFQAIFIPDHARNVALAAAALAYEEFSVGHFHAKKGARTIALVGLSGWNHNSLVTSGNEYVRDSRFTDIFDRDAQKEFVRDYKGAHKREPSSLEAAVVDAGRLLAHGAKANKTTRGEFAEAMQAAAVTGAATGTTGFDEQHRTKAAIEILTIDYNGIRIVE